MFVFCSLYVFFHLLLLENGTVLFSFFILYRYYCRVYSHFLPNFLLTRQCLPRHLSLCLSLPTPFYLLFSLSLPIFCHWTRIIFENYSLSLSLWFAIVHIKRMYSHFSICYRVDWFLGTHRHSHSFKSLPFFFLLPIKHRLRFCFSFKLVIMKSKAHKDNICDCLLLTLLCCSCGCCCCRRCCRFYRYRYHPLIW